MVGLEAARIDGDFVGGRNAAARRDERDARDLLEERLDAAGRDQREFARGQR